jgi:hypothetical protein
VTPAQQASLAHRAQEQQVQESQEQQASLAQRAQEQQGQEQQAQQE